MKKNSRYNDSLISQFSSENENSLILKSSNDIGVRLNGGRNGARFAPEAIINVLGKMTHHQQEFLPLKQVEVWPSTTLTNFENLQEASSDKIFEHLSHSPAKRIIHLGGGHDHAYPFLKGILNLKKYKNILIINIDAHCDTRIENFKHSGTPFRDFDQITNIPTHIIQYGIHNFANSNSTLSPLTNISETKILKSPESFSNFLSHLKSIPFELSEETFVYFSLDADALSASFMTAVSAVNHNGIELDEFNMIMEKVLSIKSEKAFGIYEYNPIYDDLSQRGARTIAGFIYQWLNKA